MNNSVLVLPRIFAKTCAKLRKCRLFCKECKKAKNFIKWNKWNYRKYTHSHRKETAVNSEALFLSLNFRIFLKEIFRKFVEFCEIGHFRQSGKVIFNSPLVSTTLIFLLSLPQEADWNVPDERRSNIQAVWIPALGERQRKRGAGLPCRAAHSRHCRLCFKIFGNCSRGYRATTIANSHGNCFYVM